MNPYTLAAFAIWKTCEFGGKLIRGEYSRDLNTNTCASSEQDKDEPLEHSPCTCEGCGHQNPDNSHFCSECGSPLACQQQSQE